MYFFLLRMYAHSLKAIVMSGGQTLNQYITEYRMEKAKQLLKDARFKITDISSRVGYSDGNYFGKSFKKYSGLSPSEYRERNLQ